MGAPENDKDKKAVDEPRFVTPPNKLKAKVGEGGIPAETLKRGQDYLQSSAPDFEPYARDFLTRLDAALAKAEKAKGAANQDAALDELTGAVMQLKANGAMFRYPLVSAIADIVLQFLDKAGALNADVCDIVRAHNRTLSILIEKQIRGKGGAEGQALVRELQEACQRYYKKYRILA